MIIAVDFDGTIVEDQYPGIGREKPFAFDCLLRIQKELNHRLILWTVREGDLLEEAIQFCRKRGLVFYAVNKNNPEEKGVLGYRKLKVDLFIDDRNLGGLPDWGVVYRLIESGKVEDSFEMVFQSAYDGCLSDFLKSNVFLRIGAWLEKNGH